jgi:hypothetical protein
MAVCESTAKSHAAAFLLSFHFYSIRIVPAAGPSCWDGVCRVE